MVYCPAVVTLQCKVTGSIEVSLEGGTSVDVYFKYITWLSIGPDQKFNIFFTFGTTTYTLVLFFSVRTVPSDSHIFFKYITIASGTDLL